MTLITYPVRAHFADGVLEEALRSELETHDFKAPLIIGEESMRNSEFTERLYAGFPRGCRLHHYDISDDVTKEQAAEQVRELAAQNNSDVLIAYGSVRAISYSRKCRHVLQRDRGKAGPIDLFAIPGVDGLPGPCRERRVSSQLRSDPTIRTGLPSILICDPTLTIGADQERSVVAAMTALIQCLEAYLSEAFNPPADGMALDGLRRIAQMLPILGNDTIEIRREMMAASFNAMLSQQKGIGPAQLIGDALKARNAAQFESEVAASLLLPGVLRAYSSDAGRLDVVRQALGVEKGVDLPDGLDAILTHQHFPKSLSQIGISRESLDHVAADLSESLALPARAGGNDIMAIMEAVF